MYYKQLSLKKFSYSFTKLKYKTYNYARAYDKDKNSEILIKAYDCDNNSYTCIINPTGYKNKYNTKIINDNDIYYTLLHYCKIYLEYIEGSPELLSGINYYTLYMTSTSTLELILEKRLDHLRSIKQYKVERVDKQTYDVIESSNNLKSLINYIKIISLLLRKSVRLKQVNPFTKHLQKQLIFKINNNI